MDTLAISLEDESLAPVKSRFQDIDQHNEFNDQVVELLRRLMAVCY